LQPRADGSQNWVEREIDLFLDLPQGKNIFAVRIGSSVNRDLPGRLLERFPQITIVEIKSFRPLLDNVLVRASVRDPLLTILGTLYSVEQARIPELRMEELRRARSYAVRIAIAAVLLLLLI
jgi:hypothetical protein